MNIETLCGIRCHLGEGPVWNVEERALYWIDSLGPTVFRYDWAAGTTRRWNLPGKAVGSLAVRCGGGLILAMDAGFHTFDLATGEQIRRYEGHTNYVLGVDWKGDGQTLVSCSADNSIKIWNAATGDQLRTIANVNNYTKPFTAVRYVGQTGDLALALTRTLK